MDIKITPANLSGKIEAVSSKSYAHRLFLAAALSNERTEIYMKNGSSDLNVTLEVLKNFGVRTSFDGNVVTVAPVDFLNVPDKVSINVHDSVATLRFLLPIISAVTPQVTYDGEGKILLRPYTELLYTLKGVGFSSEKLPFTIKGSLLAGEYRIPPQVSMQFVSGLMFALPLLKQDSKIIFMQTPNTVNTDMTMQVLSIFGVSIDKTDYGYYIAGNQKYISPQKVVVEGDWALSSVWKLCQRLGGKIEIENLNPSTLQTEKANFDIIDGLFDGKNEICDVDLDLLPLLTVASVFLNRKTEIRLAKKPTSKELIKINTLILALNKLGADVVGNDLGLVVNGMGRLSGGGLVDCFGDFRLAMAIAVAGCFSDNPIKILDVQSILKHYPTFFNDINALGGKAQVE